MAYTATVWVNDQAPALSAANLNKLTDEIEAQAASLSIVHSLPNWTDGAAPALTDAAPLNEMETTVAAISTALGRTYTPTVWQSGWKPARNAARFNQLEQMVALNSTGAVVQPGAEFPGTSPEGIVMAADATAGTLSADYAGLRSRGIRVCRKEVTDARVLVAAQNDLMFLPLIYGQGDTFHGGSTTNVVNAVNRYARGGTFWTDNPGFSSSIQPIWFEIGNEPYLSHEGMWNTVATWAQGWYASVVAAKSAKPNIKAILPCGLDILGPSGWRPWTDYVLDAEPRIANVMDGWSCHPYARNNGVNPSTYTDFSGGNSTEFQRYNYIREKLAARGVSKPWCITEFGWHTDSTSGGGQGVGVTEAQQATFFGTAYDILASGGAKGMPKPMLVSHYTVKDTGTDPLNPEHHYGWCFRADRSVKPAAAVIQDRAT